MLEKNIWQKEKDSGLVEERVRTTKAHWEKEVMEIFQCQRGMKMNNKKKTHKKANKKGTKAKSRYKGKNRMRQWFKMNHWNYTQMQKKRPDMAQREKVNLSEFFIMKPDYSDVPSELREAIEDSS